MLVNWIWVQCVGSKLGDLVAGQFCGLHPNELRLNDGNRVTVVHGFGAQIKYRHEGRYLILVQSSCGGGRHCQSVACWSCRFCWFRFFNQRLSTPSSWFDVKPSLRALMCSRCFHLLSLLPNGR